MFRRTFFQSQVFRGLEKVGNHCTWLLAFLLYYRFFFFQKTQDAGELKISPEKITLHPFYQFPRNDFAIIRLSQPLTLSDKIGLACLPLNGESSYLGQDLVIIGWGLTKTGAPPDTLMYGHVQSFSHEECEKMLSAGIE